MQSKFKRDKGRPWHKTGPPTPGALLESSPEKGVTNWIMRWNLESEKGKPYSPWTWSRVLLLLAVCRAQSCTDPRKAEPHLVGGLGRRKKDIKGSPGCHSPPVPGWLLEIRTWVFTAPLFLITLQPETTEMLTYDLCTNKQIVTNLYSGMFFRCFYCN